MHKLTGQDGSHPLCSAMTYRRWEVALRYASLTPHGLLCPVHCFEFLVRGLRSVARRNKKPEHGRGSRAPPLSQLPKIMNGSAVVNTSDSQGGETQTQKRPEVSSGLF